MKIDGVEIDSTGEADWDNIPGNRLGWLFHQYAAWKELAAEAEKVCDRLKLAILKTLPPEGASADGLTMVIRQGSVERMSLRELRDEIADRDKYTGEECRDLACAATKFDTDALVLRPRLLQLVEAYTFRQSTAPYPAFSKKEMPKSWTDQGKLAVAMSVEESLRRLGVVQ